MADCPHALFFQLHMVILLYRSTKWEGGSKVNGNKKKELTLKNICIHRLISQTVPLSLKITKCFPTMSYGPVLKTSVTHFSTISRAYCIFIPGISLDVSQSLSASPTHQAPFLLLSHPFSRLTASRYIFWFCRSQPDRWICLDLLAPDSRFLYHHLAATQASRL